MNTGIKKAGVAAVMLLAAQASQGAVIDYTGGTAYYSGGGTVVTDTTTTNWGIDYYEENGFRIDFIGDTGIIGDYYGGGNDVIHGHWATGNFGTLTEIRISKIDGTTFDLNYFELTSNTDTGGWLASGNELAYITGYDAGGTQISTNTLLPPDDWGWTGTNPQVFLDSTFDNVSYVSITAANAIDCFGMDMFYIDEAAPPPHGGVPVPAPLAMLGLGLVGMAMQRRRKSA